MIEAKALTKQIKKAEMYALRNFRTEALDIYMTLLGEVSSRKEKAMIHRRIAELSKNKYPEMALEHYQKALSHDKKNDKFRIVVANALVQQGSVWKETNQCMSYYEQADEVLTGIRDRHTLSSYNYHTLRAFVSQRLSDYSTAATSLQELKKIQLAEDKKPDWFFYLKLSNCLGIIGEIDKSIEAATQSIEACKGKKEMPIVLRAGLYSKKIQDHLADQNRDKAKEYIVLLKKDYRDVLHLNPNHQTAMLYLATYLIGNLEENPLFPENDAETKELESLLSKLTNMPEMKQMPLLSIWEDLGMVKHHLAKEEEAEKAFNKAIELCKGKDIYTLFLRGDYYLDLDKKSLKAVKDFLEICSIEPKMEHYFYKCIAKIYFRRKNIFSATKYFFKTIRKEKINGQEYILKERAKKDEERNKVSFN